MGLYETIKYQVIESQGSCEIREYDDILLASTKSSMNAFMDSGFGDVFNYISGNNKEKTKISMTTPVVSYEEDDKLVTGFYVPSKYDKNTIPQPTGNQVFIQELKKSLYAVITFRGAWTKSNYDKHDVILKAYIEESGYQILSPRFIFRYQPPFVPGIFRHNEIAYQVKK